MSQASPHSYSHSATSSLESTSGRAPWHYKSTWDAAKKMYTHEGLASFYSGLTPALLGLSHVAVQFPLYEYLKFKFTGMEMGQERNPSDNEEGRGGGASAAGAGTGTSHWVGMSVATVLSKICASTATYPHEVLRTRLQTQQLDRRKGAAPISSQVGAASGSAQGMVNANGNGKRYHGILNTVKTILREEGWRAFYVGMGTNMIRAVPAAATTILTYEYVVGRIKTVQSEGIRKRTLLGEGG